MNVPRTRRHHQHVVTWAWVLALAALATTGIARARSSAPLGPSPGTSGGRLTLAQLRALAVLAGFSDPDVAAAVAMAESRGNPAAQNVTSREASYGLWQINVRAHPQYDAARLLDPTYNAQAAFAIRQASGWAPWSTYTHGDYLQYMGGQS